MITDLFVEILKPVLIKHKTHFYSEYILNVPLTKLSKSAILYLIILVCYPSSVNF